MAFGTRVFKSWLLGRFGLESNKGALRSQGEPWAPHAMGPSCARYLQYETLQRAMSAVHGSNRRNLKSHMSHKAWSERSATITAAIRQMEHTPLQA